MEYLLKSILCLLVLLLFHRLVLQQEVLHRFNRFFLLAAVIGSFLIPLVTIEMEREIAVESIPSVFYPTEHLSLEPSTPNDTAITLIPKAESAPATLDIPWSKLGWASYLMGVAFFLIRFIRNISLLYDQIRKNYQVTYRQETVVLLPGSVSPFSFLKYIFYSKTAYEKAGIPDAVFLHEQCHVREKHTLDIMLVELLLIIFWFHPGLYLARQAIRLNHEFIADDQVIKQFPLREYQSILISILSGQQGFALGSSLNFPLTKKRFEMMKRKTANSTKWMKILLVLPVLGASVYFFSEKVAANAEANSELQVITTSEENSNEEKSYTLVYGSPIQILTKAEYYSETKFFVKDAHGNSKEYSYDELPENYKNDLPGPPGALKKNMPSSDLFESWKNVEEFAIWIDDKVAPNSDLKEMEVSDVAHYQSSFVHTNARSERFPQNYQVRIYTFSGFERSYGKDSNFGKKPMGGTVTFNAVTSKNKPISGISSQESNDHQLPTSEKYSRQVTEFQLKISNAGMFTSPSDAEISALQVEFQEMETTYFNLSLEERRKVKRAGFPFAKIEKDGQIRYKKFEFLTSEERKALAC